MSITIQKKDYSLYEIKIKNYSDMEFSIFMQNYVNLFKNLNERISIIFNASSVDSLALSQLTNLTSFLNTMKNVHKEKLYKFALIVKNTNIKNLLEGAFMIVPPVRPYVITTKFSEAESYVLENCHLI